MGIGNFIKKLIETNAIWGVRAKQLAGINDAGNVITTSIVVSTTDNSIDFAPLPVPSFFKVGQYIRIFGGPNDSKLLRISNILEGTKLIVEEPVIADSGTRRVTARLWEIHDDPSISRPSSTGSTMFNVHNRQPTNVPEDASALAFTFAEHYHDEEGPEDDFGYLVEDQYVPYGKLVITNFKGIKGQWSYYNERYYICIATDTWIYLPTENFVNRVIEERFNQFQDQYIPYGKLVASSFKGIKGQWSYSADYFYLCIATDTWKVIADKNYVDSEDLKTRIGAGLEDDGSYLADENTNYIAQASSLKNADFKLDEKLKNLDDNFNSYVNLINDQYVPFNYLQAQDFKGIKGQWSYNDNRYYKCIATDTWFVTSNENLVDEKINDLLKQFVNQYVPCCLVPSNSSPGLKGQWSFQVGHSSHKGYVKICIATDTWVRFQVDTLF
jgi:hypothetical protein